MHLHTNYSFYIVINFYYRLTEIIEIRKLSLVEWWKRKKKKIKTYPTSVYLISISDSILSAKVERSCMSSVFFVLLLFFCILLLNSSVCKSNILLLKWEKSMLRQYIYADGICNIQNVSGWSLCVTCIWFFLAHLNKRVQNFYDHLLSVVCSLVYKLFTFITYLFKGVGYIQSNLAQIFSIEGESK